MNEKEPECLENEDSLDSFIDQVENGPILTKIQDSGEYFGHFIPIEGTGAGVGEGVLTHLQNYEVQLDKLQILMTDGTSKMTGWKSGSIAVIEKKLGRPLQHGICLNHHIEKPFEYIFEHYDGEIKGPNAFSGPIGQSMQNEVWKKEIVEFEALDNPELSETLRIIPEEVLKDLGADHRHACMFTFFIQLKVLYTDYNVNGN